MKIYQYYKNNPMRSLVFASSAIATLFLILALVAQYGFHMHPCELCLAQRVPYAIIALLALIMGMKTTSQRKLSTVALVCALLFLSDAAIAGYHSGVERGIFKGPSACTNNDKGGESLEEMRAAIMNAQLVPCDQPMAYFFGLSMATWNMGAALLTSAFVAVMRSRINKQAGVPG